MSSSSEDEIGRFRINTEYAQRYNKWREKEELQKLKDKYGDVSGEEISSSSESEDEDAEALTAQLEKDWLRTLAAIKSKDPKIYDPSVKFFSEADNAENVKDSQKKRKQKPLYLKDYERKLILERGGIVSESEDNDETVACHANQKKNEPSYYEEQEEIKQSIKAAIGESDESGDDTLLIPRTKDKEEEEREEEEYLLWLKGQKQELDADEKVGTELNSLRQYWTKPNLTEEEKFLRDYILDKKYLDDDDDERIPTYEEIIQNEDISEEEKEIEKEEEFERKYNFRFEEPDPEFIKCYPRTIGDSVRRKKDKRARKRQADRERKKKEKQKKMEELKQLKNLKKKEILEKLEKIKEITGNPNVGFTEDDIDGDFDPAKHDKVMKEVFDEGYYMDADGEKPVFSDDDELELDDENWDKWQGTDVESGQWQGTSITQDDEDEDFNMDADYVSNQEANVSTSNKKRKTKKSKLAEALERQKPVFNPDEKTFEEYFDEYYKLNYEDIIGDLPCRFKYRKVVENDFGLDTAEILTCPDRELNAWVSVKKMCQYRTKEEEEYDKKVYQKKACQLKKKKNILPSLFKASTDNLITEKSGSKKKRKRKRKKSFECPQPVTNDSTLPDVNNVSEKDKTESKQKKSKQPHRKHKMGKKKEKCPTRTGNRGFNMSEERLKAYGIDPRKFKYTYLKNMKEQKKKAV